MNKLLVVFGILAAGAAGFGGYMLLKQRAQENSPDEHAMKACHEAMRSHLKAPSTASFPGIDDSGVKVSLIGGKYRVKSYVDAENSFGAKIRSRFECKVARDGDTWTTEHIEVD